MTMALSDNVTVLRAELIETLAQSSNTNPTAAGAVRPGEEEMLLSAIVGPSYPPAEPPSTMNTLVPPSPKVSLRVRV